MKRTLALALMLTACAAPVGLTNYHEVDPGKVYRAAQLDAESYKIIAKAGIRTVVKLNTEHLEEERVWARDNKIDLVYVPLPGLGAPSDDDETVVQRALRDPARQPSLVHCEWGKDRTGLAIAIYRVDVQHMPKADARDEWLHYGHLVVPFSGMDAYFKKRTRDVP